MPKPTRSEVLKQMTLGADGVVQLDIVGNPQPLTRLCVNGVEIDPHHVLSPMSASVGPGGRVELAMRWFVDEVLMATADGKHWRLDANGNFTNPEKENPDE